MFDDAHLRRLASDLSQLALQFIVAEARKVDPLSEALELQKALKKPQLKKQLAVLSRKVIAAKALENSTLILVNDIAEGIEFPMTWADWLSNIFLIFLNFDAN